MGVGMCLYVSEILVENCDFCTSWGVPSRRNIFMRFGTKILDGEKSWRIICLFVSTQYSNVTDRQTDGQTDTARG